MKRFLLFAFIALSQFVNAQDLYDINTLREITVKFYDANFHQILIDRFNAGDGSRLPATLEMDGVLYDSVAIRYKGNISFMIPEHDGNPKYPLNIDMNEFIDGQNLLGYNKLKLGNLMTDPTAVREAVAYEIYRKYTVAPKSNMMKVNIGVVGQTATYYGVYSNSESINKGFLESHFDSKNGALAKCDPNPAAQDTVCDKSGLGNGIDEEQLTAQPDLKWYGPDTCQYYANYAMKRDYGWQELVELIDVLNHNENTLDQHLNIDGVLWYMAVSMVIPNKDTYFGENAKNYYMYKHKDGLWHMLPWDVNESFGGVMGKSQGGASYDLLRRFEAYDPTRPWRTYRPLVYQILKNDRYRKQYFAHVRTVIDENYSDANIRAQVDSVQDLIEQAVFDSPHRIFPDDDFRKNVNEDITYSNLSMFNYFGGIMPTVNDRLTYLNNHAEVQLVPPTLENTTQSILAPKVGEDVWITAEVSNATQVDLMVTINKKYASYFQPIEMKDDGLSNDGAAGDGIYGALIPYNAIYDEVKYYVRAQNDDAMILEPRRAEYEFFEYKVKSSSVLALIGDVVINEFLASNDGAAADQNGEYDDWIELYNTTNSDISLNGYFLTDDSLNINKWAFSDTLIKAKSYLIIWADKDDSQDGLHANFKLSSSGESVYLVNNDLEIVDYTHFTSQSTDMTYARVPNGTGSFSQQEPTFSFNNQGELNTSLVETADLFKIYPNPAKDYVNIIGDLETLNSIKILDATGKVVSQSFDASSNRISIANLSNGFYTIAIETGEGMALKKLMITK